MEKRKLKGMVFAALFAALTGAVAWFKIPLPFTPVPITLQTLAVLLSGAMLGSYYGALSMIIYLILGSIGLPIFAGGSSGFGALLGSSGGYLLSYPVASFVIGKMLEKKNLTKFLKYASFIVIMLLIAIVILDSTLEIGIMKMGGNSSGSYVPMVSLLTSQQRVFLVAFSMAALAVLLFLFYYFKRSKPSNSDTMLAMFAGTLIIYLMGAVQGKFVTGVEWNAVFVGWVLPFIIGDTIKLLAAVYICGSIDVKKYMK